MKLFQNRFFAILLAILVVIGSTLINTNIKFGRKCKEVSDQFYGSSVSRGGSEVSIAEALEAICVEAETLSVVADDCGVDAAAVTNAVSNLRRDIHNEFFYGIRSSYDVLRSGLTTMLGQLAQVNLDDQSARTVSGCSAAIADLQSAIAASDYNDTVRAFLRRYDHFPTAQLAELAGVEMPQAFS